MRVCGNYMDLNKTPKPENMRVINNKVGKVCMRANFISGWPNRYPYSNRLNSSHKNSTPSEHIVNQLSTTFLNP